MAAWKRISTSLALAALAFSSVNVAIAANQLPLGNINCTLATIPNAIRAEEITARAGEARLDCVNDGSRDSGDTTYQQYIDADFRLRLNINVTSMIHEVGGGSTFTESLLVINGNDSLGSEIVSKLPDCDTFTAPDPRYPCPQNGDLTGADTLTWDNVQVPVPGAPNDPSTLNADDAGFQGASADLDTDFDCDLLAGPLDATGCFDQVTTLRFVNLRANATGVFAGGGTVTANFNVTSTFPIAIIGSRSGLVAEAFVGLFAQVSSTFFGRQCQDESGTGSIEFSEGFAAAFKPLRVATFLESDYSTENGYPVDGAGTATQATQFRIELTGLSAGINIAMPDYIDEDGGTVECAPPQPGGGNLCLG